MQTIIKAKVQIETAELEPDPGNKLLIDTLKDVLMGENNVMGKLLPERFCIVPPHIPSQYHFD